MAKASKIHGEPSVIRQFDPYGLESLTYILDRLSVDACSNGQNRGKSRVTTRGRSPKVRRRRKSSSAMTLQEVPTDQSQRRRQRRRNGYGFAHQDEGVLRRMDLGIVVDRHENPVLSRETSGWALGIGSDSQADLDRLKAR